MGKAARRDDARPQQVDCPQNLWKNVGGRLGSLNFQGPNMVSHHCYPPRKQHATSRILPSTALHHISDYLSAASTNAALHPNALLTGGGPITPSSSTDQFGLVLHNLKRVEVGLRGEQLAPDVTFDNDAEGEPHAMESASQELSYEPNGDSAIDVDGWQDKEEFEREQDIEQGEIGARNNVPATKRTQVPKVKVKGSESGAEKDARRRQKKERRLQARRDQQVRKQMEADVES